MSKKCLIIIQTFFIVHKVQTNDEYLKTQTIELNALQPRINFLPTHRQQCVSTSSSRLLQWDVVYYVRNFLQCNWDIFRSHCNFQYLLRIESVDAYNTMPHFLQSLLCFFLTKIEFESHISLLNMNISQKLVEQQACRSLLNTNISFRTVLEARFLEENKYHR